MEKEEAKEEEEEEEEEQERGGTDPKTRTRHNDVGNYQQLVHNFCPLFLANGHVRTHTF